ncbi:nickel ABC transporter permease [Desulfosarcina ovata]|uniref:ABC transporter permease n=1 Tax=Desulfosarcina ovata subsp. ovata TaxID=2752305 RepID=A0A5K8AAR6_9BACT|nr:nickel ABC transporter permease [Desulfosarcina ovata]BBO89606.1 ABC transporter permease [Desulfosarcina ovata subsp. ovata]
MIAFILRRLLLSMVVMLGAAILSFALISLAPGNAAESILSAVRVDDPRMEELTFFTEAHGLDSPVLIRLTQWACRLSRGDLGTSLRTGEPVAEEFWSRFPATLVLATASMVLAIFLGLPLGVVSAVKQNSRLDHLSRLIALGGVSIPNFWLGMMLILFFGVGLGWLPTFGYGGLPHLILPTITLGTGLAAILMRLQRASMLDVLNKNYIRTARAKGLDEFMVIGKHAFKNTLIPVITIIGIQFAHLLSGVVIVEEIFAWPGIGHFLIEAIHAKDYPVIQGFVLLIALFFVLTNLFVDMIYALCDPRVRHLGNR